MLSKHRVPHLTELKILCIMSTARRIPKVGFLAKIEGYPIFLGSLGKGFSAVRPFEVRQVAVSIRTLQIANASQKTRQPRQHTPLWSISTAQPGGHRHSVDTQFCRRLSITLA